MLSFKPAFSLSSFTFRASLVAQMGKRMPAVWRPRFDCWVGKIPWRRKWQPTPVLLLGKFHGWKSLVGYSPWGRKESDTTEPLHFHFFSSSLLSAIRVVSSAYVRLLIFLPAILIPACASSSLAFPVMYSAYKLNKQGDNI